MESHRVKPRCQTVALATVELVETLHQSFPDAVIKPSEPFEDEDVCLTVYGLWDVEELQRIRNQIYKLEFTLYGQVIRRYLSGSGLLAIVHTRFMIIKFEDGIESQPGASYSVIPL